MKKRTTPNKLGVFKYVLMLPALLLLTYCQSDLDEPAANAEIRLTKDSEILNLMRAAIISDCLLYTSPSPRDA